jgi:Protein of unknown function (DUF3489)
MPSGHGGAQAIERAAIPAPSAYENFTMTTKTKTRAPATLNVDALNAAIGVEVQAAQARIDAKAAKAATKAKAKAKDRKAALKTKAAKVAKAKAAPKAKSATKAKAKNGTKQDMVLAMLRKPKGASVAAIVNATGWMAHTARSFLSRVVPQKPRPETSHRQARERRWPRLFPALTHNPKTAFASPMPSGHGEARVMQEPRSPRPLA